MMRRLAALAALCLLAGACSPSGAPPPASAPPAEASPTFALAEASPTAGPTATPGPLTEATQPIVLEPPDLPPTATLIPPPVNLPPENISILDPGPGSQITSPFRVIGRGGPSFNDRVEVRLIGEDGRVIDDGMTLLLAYPGGAGRFVTELSFQTSLVAELARLEVLTYDRRYNRVSNLASMPLVLLSAGGPRVHPGRAGPEKLAILAPREGAVVTGGRIVIDGAGWLDADVPLTVQLLDRDGAPLASAQVRLDAPGVGQVGTFHVEFVYQVPFGQYGRVAVSEPSTGIPGLIHMTSVEVYLRP